MIAGPELALYFALVFGIIVLPGMDMAFVMGHSLVGGLRSGASAVAGIMAGGLCHMVIGAAGVALVVKAVPGLFTAMLLAGAAYVAWIGWSVWRAASAADAGNAPAPASSGKAFRGAIATSLLNPKAYLFTLAVMPQFVHPERGGFWVQVAELAAVTNATQAAVYGGLAVAASRGGGWLKANPHGRRLLMRVVGAGLVATAGFTAWTAVG